MLSLGPGSACDVCLEPFGHDAKAPHSIQCGHIFCLDCLNHITRLLCPLCRNGFEASGFIKIHIDVDNVRSSPRAIKAGPTSSSPAEDEARRLQEAIASVANAGTTEARLRQLIEEGRTFLASQPRTLFQDLRVSHRMIAYLCEVKSRLRAQNQVVDGLNERLVEMGKEKAELEQRIENLVETNKDEKETALAVEMSLREHCSRANAAYEIMEDRYKFVLSGWERLNEEVKRLRLGSLSLESDPQEHPIDVQYTLPDMPSLIPLDPPPNSADLPMNLKGLNVDDQDSFLISPLPEFTGRLPSSLVSFTALPEVNDELEKKTRDASLDFSLSSPSCGATGHPLSCHCVPFPVFPEMPPPSSYEDQRIASCLRGPSIPEPIINVQPSTPVAAEPMPIPIPDAPRTPSGLSLTAPKGRELLGQGASRSRSFSSHPSSHSRPSSRPPTLPSSPLLRPTSTTVQGQYASSHDSSTLSTHMDIPHGPEQLRTRLHNLLHDPNPNMSSSLPNMPTAHLHSTDSRDVNYRDNTPRPSSRSTSARPLPPPPSNKPVAGHSHTALPSQPVSTNVNLLVSSNSSATTTMTTTSHNPAAPQRPAMVSHASCAALALEKAQRAEKERQRAEQKRERERRNSETEREAERSRTQPMPAIPGSPMGRSSSHREAKSFYTLSGSSSSGSSLRRETSSSHVRSNMSSLRDSTNASVAQHQRYATAGSSKGKISTHLASSSVAGVYA